VLYLALFIFIMAVILLIISARQKHEAGLPAGRVIYADTSRWGKVEKALFNPNLGLTGKPDYLVEQGDQIVPVEVKSGRAPQSPYDSHIFQLAAYCLLVDYAYGKRPGYGIIHYPDRTFAVDFNPALESAVLVTINEMQQNSVRKQVDRSHEAPERCARCGFRSICDQSLRI
jgi:CRISPR-associated exonuclease Cas4